MANKNLIHTINENQDSTLRELDILKNEDNINLEEIQAMHQKQLEILEGFEQIIEKENAHTHDLESE